MHNWFNAFIHKRHGEWINVGDPFNLYGGDNRVEGASGTSRVSTVASIETSLLDTDHAVTRLDNLPGISKRKSNITGSIDSRKSKLEVDTKSKGSGKCTAFAFAQVSVTNPFNWVPSPPSGYADKYIDYSFLFVVSFLRPGVVKIDVDMTFDRFPDYELIASYTGLRFHYPAPGFIEGLAVSAGTFHVNDIVNADTPKSCVKVSAT